MMWVKGTFPKGKQWNKMIYKSFIFQTYLINYIQVPLLTVRGLDPKSPDHRSSLLDYSSGTKTSTLTQFTLREKLQTQEPRQNTDLTTHNLPGQNGEQERGLEV